LNEKVRKATEELLTDEMLKKQGISQQTRMQY